MQEIFCFGQEKCLNLEKRLLYSPKETLESLIKNNLIYPDKLLLTKCNTASIKGEYKCVLEDVFFTYLD